MDQAHLQNQWRWNPGAEGTKLFDQIRHNLGLFNTEKLMKIIHNNSWLSGKDLDAGEGWKRKKRATEDEMIGWPHQSSRHELGQTLRDGEGQGSQHAAVHRIAKSWTWLSRWTELNLRALFLENQPEMTALYKGNQIAHIHVRCCCCLPGSVTADSLWPCGL